MSELIIEKVLAEAEGLMASTVHACPRRGSGLTPCCKESPFFLPRTDRMTLDPKLVTCRGQA